MENSLQTDPRIAALRTQLKKEFASAHRDPPAVRECIETGVDWLDREGIGKGTVCEIYSGGTSGKEGAGRSHTAGGGVAFHRMLTHAVRKQQHLVLIDGADAFDPASHPTFSPENAGAASGNSGAESQRGGAPPEKSSPLDGTFLWARCRSVSEAIKVADLIVRDANLPRVILDLQLCDLREVRRVASSSWFRLRSQLEENGGTLIAFTPAPVIPSASLRFEMRGLYTLNDCESPESQWTGKLRVRVVRDRVVSSSDQKKGERNELSLAS